MLILAMVYEVGEDLMDFRAVLLQIRHWFVVLLMDDKGPVSDQEEVH